MQAVGSRVIADIKGYLFLSQELAELFGVGALLEKASISYTFVIGTYSFSVYIIVDTEILPYNPPLFKGRRGKT